MLAMRKIYSFPTVVTRSVAQRLLNRSIGTVLDGNVPYSAEFYENQKAMKTLTKQLEGLIQKIHECGGKKALQRQKERGKLPVRERVDRLLDPGSPFLEIGLYGGYEIMYEGMWVPCGGIVTGIGVVNG
jgi:3-methylcrotonyl-CoA carboxylase beta subunit